jgi:hypothetical protein
LAARHTTLIISPSLTHPSLCHQVATFRAEHVAEDEYLIGVHFRGTDKKKKAYPWVSPSYEVFAYYVDKVVERYVAALAPDGTPPDQLKWKMFVATDEAEFPDWAKKRWPGHVFAWPNVPRLSSKVRGRLSRSQSLALSLWLGSVRLASHLVSFCSVLRSLVVAGRTLLLPRAVCTRPATSPRSKKPSLAFWT